MKAKWLSWVLIVIVALVCALTPRTVQAIDEEGCYRCHGLEGFVSRSDAEIRQLVISPVQFEDSVHWPLNCRECHSDVFSIPHPEATREVSCGQPCHQRDQTGKEYSHEALYWEYTTSVHGTHPGRKISCTLCHPASSLLKVGPRGKMVEIRQCASCHRDNARVQDYLRDFHYQALRRGNKRAPSCPDCHTAHRVKPSNDPESSVHSARLAGTCGSGASSSTARGCHGTLSPEAVQGAGMTPLPLTGGGSRMAGLAFSLGYWGLLIGLLVRAGIGFLKRR